MGEISCFETSKLPERFYLVAVLYNAGGQIVGADKISMNSGNFPGINVFRIIILDKVGGVTKIRVYPQTAEVTNSGIQLQATVWAFWKAAEPPVAMTTCKVRSHFRVRFPVSQ
jgi:hypothetical protein